MGEGIIQKPQLQKYYYSYKVIVMKGLIVALVTPMKESGEIDFEALKNLLDWHAEAKTDALVILGSTGEAATVHLEERRELISFVTSYVKKRYPIIVCTGSYATDTTIDYTLQAKELGADAALVVTPYYNKPTQEGLYQHYKAVAETVDLPIILYNIPSRTACDLKPETVAKLSSIKNIIGIKEGSGELSRVSVLRKLCRDDFLLYSGDDMNALPTILSGGDGVISVAGNLIPEKMRALCYAALNGEVEEARKLDRTLCDFYSKLFIETNPIPIKWCMEKVSKITAHVRLPLTPLTSTCYAPLEKALHELGLLP